MDIDAVKRNAAEQGISLSEIAIFYRDLTEIEKQIMQSENVIVSDSGAVTIAKFTSAGEALFPEKISGFNCLAA